MIYGYQRDVCSAGVSRSATSGETHAWELVWGQHGCHCHDTTLQRRVQHRVESGGAGGRSC